jgi:hypothetical protein
MAALPAGRPTQFLCPKSSPENYCGVFVCGVDMHNFDVFLMPCEADGRLAVAEVYGRRAASASDIGSDENEWVAVLVRGPGPVFQHDHGMVDVACAGSVSGAQAGDDGRMAAG